MEIGPISASEQRLLDAVPSFLCISDMLKATPVTEGPDRFVYLEASNESVDYQGEVVLAKALEDSAGYFKQFGNLDIDHYTQTGPRLGIPNYELYEVGRPLDVNVRDGRTFVKGQIYQGDGLAAQKANSFWSSLTETSPPQRWYPSVGGSVIEKSLAIDPQTKAKRAIISKVRWSNIGFSKTPVNLNVGTVSTVPIGALTKSLIASEALSGFDYFKALEAGYGTDAAALTGGGALRKQSLEPNLLSYWEFRDRLADMIRNGEVTDYKPAGLVALAKNRFGLSDEVAAKSVQRFLDDLKSHRRMQ